jgi:hypothetical protein
MKAIRPVAVATLLMLTGCVYMHTQVPMDRDFNETRLGAKHGKASTHSLLWLVAWGDAGTRAAADNGGITVIRHADWEMHSILFGLYSRSTTVVYGD